MATPDAAARCPECRTPLAPDGSCPACGGRFLAPERVATLGPLGPYRRLASKGPLTRFACAACGGPLKSLDVPGALHEGDLFWGHESPRPAGSCVVDACPRCGGTYVDAGNIERAGGTGAVEEGVARVMAGAS